MLTVLGGLAEFERFGMICLLAAICCLFAERCERDFAIKAGADWAAWGTVQKVSNLILNINVYIEDARQKKMEF